MPITSLYVGNFKGIGAAVALPLRPITLFLGPNSSGKSSSLHALTVLSQTLKLPNNRSPLTLDDEYASVHLGRFIEVLHSKEYSDKLSLGLSAVSEMIFVPDEKGKLRTQKGEVSARYTFRCVKRTQEVHLSVAEYDLDGVAQYIANEQKDGSYVVTHRTSGETAVFLRHAGFLLAEDYRYRAGRPSLDEWFLFQSLQSAVEVELRRTLYLGPFRQAPLRRYPTRGVSPSEVGSQGEAAITLLANETIQKRTRPHIQQIAGWLSALGLASGFDVARVGRSDLFDVSLTLADGEAFPIADLGYGLSQVLPVLTQCSFAPRGSTLVFEQPELHLHTLAARPLATVFRETVSRGVRLLLETHSPDLLRGFQAEIASGRMNAADLALYRVSRTKKGTFLSAIPLDVDGDIYENWESGLSVA